MKQSSIRQTLVSCTQCGFKARVVTHAEHSSVSQSMHTVHGVVGACSMRTTILLTPLIGGFIRWGQCERTSYPCLSDA